MRWYKRDVSAAITGMACLSMEARGAYNGVIDMIYEREGQLKDDDALIVRTLSCDPRTWRRLKQELIEKGKIWVTADGNLMAKRIEKELKLDPNFAESSGNLRRRSGEDLPKIPKKPKDFYARRESPESRVQSLEDVCASAHTAPNAETDLFGKPPKVKRGERLPEGWEPLAKDMQLAVDELGSDRAAFRALDEFRDYWRGVPGSKGCKLDWSATWRNRVRAIADRKGMSNGHRQANGAERARELAERLRSQGL